ncbi:hypothetical protein SLS56_007538 [Neofusicoccum ribis]|uniref:Ubiquitin 3 binding protein But2 C-terminal domain-containing protein n=1 Tax=Neofusicoccum ribis TaxID=45134 RepID=A0ABR3SMR9_9PEZI
MRYSTLLGLAAGLSTAAAQYKGFNYGATFTTGAAKQQADFENEFNMAKNLVGTSGFTSARLYTMIQHGTTNTPISAIQAAIDTKTTLLLGLWASAGQANFDNEVAALKAAITQYGSPFTDLIVGISVGSEDLYRISPTGIQNLSGAGAEPQDLVRYIQQVRAAIAGTPAASAQIGHVDTWTAFVNGSNADVISNLDWLGFDGYPYFQNTMANSIAEGKALFDDSLGQTKAASQGKPVWITETGWPVSGKTENQAEASIANAKTYWDEVGCGELFGKVNTWWYSLQDALPDTPNPSFGLVPSGSSTPLFDLSCDADSSSSSSSSAASSATSSAATGGASSAASAPASTATASTPANNNGGGAPASSAATSAATTAAPSDTPSSPDDEGTTTVVVTYYTTYCPTPGVTSTATKTTAVTQTTTGFATTTVKSSPSSCPANLSGTYEYPHLIVPVDSAAPTKAHGTQYNGKVSSTVSSLFNFDIPASYAGKTCSLVFLLPNKSDLETSDFTLAGQGGIAVSQLAAPATEQTTYESVPAVAKEAGEVAAVTPGNGWVVASGPCAAGTRVGYEVAATGGLELEWFEDWNPSPIGLFVTVC